MKENSKVLIRKKVTDGSWFAVLAKGWRYDGSAVIDATSGLELDFKIAQARYDDHWVTMQGNHVLIGGNGRIKAGVGGRLKGRIFGTRFKDYERGRAKNGKRLVRPYNIVGKQSGTKKVEGKTKNPQNMHKQAIKSALAHSRLSVGHQKELAKIMSKNMTTQQAQFYSNFLGAVAKKNSYYENTGAYFSPRYNAVHMNMNNNKWERDAGINRQGALKTKFHEEFHQLDYMLSHTELGKYSSMNGHDLYSFTNPRTATGAKLSAAIEKDLVTFINNAIDKKNKDFGGPPTKHIKSTGRIPKDVKSAIDYALRDEYVSVQQKAGISMFTDALGLQTSGRVNPWSGGGFWGHNNAYCKEKGKKGANSEVWAHFGEYKFAFNGPARNAMENLMPNTIKVCNDIFDEIVNNYSDFNGW